MAKIKQSPKLPPEKRREQLLKAALRLFVKKGYRATTTEEIARKAGLTKGALYHHFSSKEDMLFELVKSLAEKSRKSVKDRITTKVKPAELLRVLTEMHNKCDVPEHQDMMDIWSQAMRISRIKRYITRRFNQDLVDIRGVLDLPDDIHHSKVTQLAIFIYAYHIGLDAVNLFGSRKVDVDNQIKLFENSFDVDKLRASSGKGGKK